MSSKTELCQYDKCEAKATKGWPKSGELAIAVCDEHYKEMQKLTKG